MQLSLTDGRLKIEYSEIETAQIKALLETPKPPNPPSDTPLFEWKIQPNTVRAEWTNFANRFRLHIGIVED